MGRCACSIEFAIVRHTNMMTDPCHGLIKQNATQSWLRTRLVIPQLAAPPSIGKVPLALTNASPSKSAIPLVGFAHDSVSQEGQRSPSR